NALSILDTCRLTPDGVTPSLLAAFVKLPVSTTATKAAMSGNNAINSFVFMSHKYFDL
ncbi:MAG: hypothetical protein ACJAWI_002902, partial [Marinomonas primoryensis]